MHTGKYICGIFAVMLMLTLVAVTDASNADVLLNSGKLAIENGEYEKAVDCLGKILEASGNESNDDKVVAFGATVQAYGLWKMNNPQMKSMVLDYLNKAIARDSSWQYPKKLLKEVKGQ